MSTNVDPQRSIAAWLEAEAPDRAPERLVASSRERIRTTRQRRAWWPARRESDMNALARLAMAVAAVVVVAIVGYNLLPSGSNVGVIPASPSPSPSISPSASPSPSASIGSLTGDVPAGVLDAGTYDYKEFFTGVTIRFTVPAGWIWAGGYLTPRDGNPPDGMAIGMWSGPAQVYTDPCQWQGAEPNPPTGPTARDLVDALAAQPTRNASTPTERKANGLDAPDRWRGWTVDLTVPADVDFATCSNGEFRSWGDEHFTRDQQGAGQRDSVWAVDVEPDTLIIIDLNSFPAAPGNRLSEAAAILDSMVFIP